MKHVHVVMAYAVGPIIKVGQPGVIVRAFAKPEDAEAFIQSYEPRLYGFAAVTIEPVEVQP